jgi:antitoxin component of RelBE/YafQ-DinJ toxin-antitoxin module
MTDLTKLYGITDNMGTYLMRVLRDELVHMPDVWRSLPEEQQQRILDRMGTQISSATKLAARRIVSTGQPSITATLQQITVKDGVKATLLFDRAEEALDALMHRVGSNLVLVLVDPNDYQTGVDEFTADADQPELPLEVNADPAAAALAEQLPDSPQE